MGQGTIPETLDQTVAHRYYAAHCFNAVWALLDLPQRTDEQNAEMVTLAHTSLWHWTQRGDRSPRTLSVGNWQVSRVYAVLGEGRLAWEYAERSRHLAAAESPFYLGYAHEALARAAASLKLAAEREQHLEKARELATQVTEQAEREMLEADLATIPAL